MMENQRKKIIMVDDEIANLNIVKKTLVDKYDIFTILSGEKLFRFLEKVTPDLILLDEDMPVMGGYEIIKILKSREDTAFIPVIFLTEANDMEREMEGLALGAIDYITKPFSPPLLLKRIEIHMLIEAQEKQLRQYKEKTNTVFNLQNAILKTVADLVERREDITEGHIGRTQRYLRILTEALFEDETYHEKVSAWDIDAFVLAAGLHDVGKIAVKDKILLKPEGLTDDEFDEIKAHTEYGVKIIRKIESSTGESLFLKYASVLAGTHHEKWDGTGYPLGLTAENIPLQGRIMALVDAYDVLTNDRPYKSAMSHEDAVKVIRAESGKHFDPGLVQAFIKQENKFMEVAQSSEEILSMPHVKQDDAVDLSDAVSQVISEIVDYRNGAAKGGVKRVQGYTRIMINAMLKHERYKEAVSTWDIDLFVLSVQLYDIGKMSVDDDILWKPDLLTQEEFAEIKTHTDLGVKAIKSINGATTGSRFIEYAENLTGRHHEKWDGTGYPSGLCGEKIPLQGRLMSIIDVYDALVSIRSYKEPHSHSEAVEIIKKGGGTQFDPGLVEVFLECEKELEAFKDA